MKQNNIKLLIITDFFYPHWTGISKSFFNLTKKLEKYFSITILTTQYNKNLSQKKYMNNVLIYRTKPQFKISRTFISIFFIPYFLKLLVKHDIVLINSPCTNILFASCLAFIFRKKIVIFHQGDLILPKGITNRIIEHIFNFSTKIACSCATIISSYSLDYAIHSRVLSPFLNKFTPLLLPVEIPSNLTHQDNNIKSTFAHLKKEDKIICGFAGRFVEEKGFDILLNAIPYLVKKIPQIHFVFAGETNMGYEHFFENHKTLISKNKKYISFLGLLNDTDLSYFYHKISLIISPSRSDCFNLVQAEAMLAGVPSIASDIPGLRYLVKNTGFGLLFKSNDPYSLTNTIYYALKIYKTLQKKHSYLVSFIQNKTTISQYVRLFNEKQIV